MKLRILGYSVECLKSKRYRQEIKDHLVSIFKSFIKYRVLRQPVQYKCGNFSVVLTASEVKALENILPKIQANGPHSHKDIAVFMSTMGCKYKGRPSIISWNY